ncbi:MAG: paraquat-inducible protein A [Flavobacteriales bacterium]
MNRNLFIILGLVFFGINIYLGVSTKTNLDKYMRYKLAYTSELNYETSLMDYKDYMDPQEWKTSRANAMIHLKKALKAKKNATYFGIFSWISILVYGFLFLIFYLKNKTSINQFGLVILNISLVLLCIGISIPFIEIGAYMQDRSIDMSIVSKTFDGKMYFFYQCKSIISLIQTLFAGNNFTVGIAILLFSIIFPFSKLGVFYFFLSSKKWNQKSKLLKIASYIGKYSMADVFVASSFLAFLSFNNLNVGMKTESSTLLGIYFFLGYCLLSIATYFVIKKKVELPVKPKTVSSLDEKY